MARSQLAVCGFVYSRLCVFPIIRDMIDWIVNSIQHRGLHLESYNHNLSVKLILDLSAAEFLFS